MNRPQRQQLPDPTILLTEGWHCLHIYYSVDRQALAAARSRDELSLDAAKEDLCRILTEAPLERVQSTLVSGHKADLGLMLMDADPLAIDRLHQTVRQSALGPYLQPTYSFVSITEVSEYVPTVEQYAERLKREGAAAEAVEARVNAYAQRLPAMNQQRLYPDFPPLPVHCFYPMNKIRHPLANWYATPLSRRAAMMSEHATSGIKFAGRVSQLITASTGFDDWEWGVTLWGRAPEHIKEIVYTMRFDEASAKYAEFGPFYIGYVVTPEDAIAGLCL